MSLPPKTRLGTYEILSPLGAGGMGEVYRARDIRLRRDVAVKVLPEAVASDPELLARLEREARTVAGLNHPNIVTLFSVEDEGGTRFITMECIEGQTLATLVTAGGLSLSCILDLTIPIADALVAAHERGIVHRDLKPGNVMVTRDGRVKVLDFGLAKVGPDEAPAPEDASTAAATAITDEGRVMGTAHYMAPEQVRGEAVDARADLFALGVMLYELTSGRRPFTGATSADVYASILRDAPQSLRRIRPDLPDGLDRVVRRCLEKKRQERIPTALEVRTELRRLRQDFESGAPSPTRPTRASDDAPSIAVLPFVNRSRDEGEEYFSDGLADELLNLLSKIRGLRVAARTSAFTFKGTNATIADVGAALHVATVLEGSVRRSGDRVRISVQLIEVSDGYHLWSETYDRTLEDIFAVQDDIAQSVVKELRKTLLGEEVDAGSRARADVAKAAKGRATEPEAHRLYLLARHLIDRRNRDDTAKAIEYLKQVLARDPNFALAWAELGGAYSREAGLDWAPVEEGYGRARAAVERALSLEPDLPEGHVQMGWIRMAHDWDWRGAETSYARALDLAPGSALVLRVAGVLARYQGRLEEAMALYRRSLEQDPLSAGSYHNLGLALQCEGRFAEGEESLRKALELAPQRLGAHAFLSLALLAQGRGEEAVAEAMREPEEWVRLYALAIVRHSMGHRPASDEALRELIEKYGTGSAYQIAEVQAVRGDADAAFAWLERAYAQRDGGLNETKTSPRLRSLHGDPRWSVFLKKMGFED